MTKQRPWHVVVLLVVISTVAVGAVAPAVAMPTDGMDGAEVGDALTTPDDDRDTGDGSDAEDDGSTSRDDGSNATDDESASGDDGTDSGDDADSSDADSHGDADSDGSREAGTDERWTDDGNESRANLTSRINRTLRAADAAFDGADETVGDVIGGGPSGISVSRLSQFDDVEAMGVDATSTADEPEGLLAASTVDTRNVYETSGDGNSLLDGVRSVIGAISDGSSTTADADGTARSSDASSAGLFGANAPGGASGDRAPAGPSAGMAIGIGAVAAVAVTRQGVLFPGLSADLGATALSALALPARALPLRARTAIDRLLRTVVPFRYSRYDDSDPLEHEARSAVFEVVQESPGAYLSELAELADVPLSTARHHVRVLEREDLVSGAKVRGKRRFYPAYATDIELSAAMNDQATAAVIDALARLGPASVSALADDVGRDPSTVTHHLQRLEEDDIVVREREGRSVVNKLSPKARVALEPETPEAEAAEAGEALASD